MKKIVFLTLIALGLLTIGSSCNNSNDTKPSNCVKGKFIGFYCDGVVIQILDNHTIGKDWKNQFNSIFYKNSVIASMDSIVFKRSFKTSVFFKDSVFYFQYKDGGYPRVQYNLCEPVPFITVFAISKNLCSTLK